MRVKSVSSELSKDKLLKDYAKSMQIKNRISRYVNSSNGVCLKYACYKIDLNAV